MTKHREFKNIEEWYSPEIDYQKMVENLRWTKMSLDKILGKSLPRQDVILMFHARAWESKDGKEVPTKQPMFQFWNKQFNDALALRLKKLKPNLILDVGAGDGNLSKILASRGFNVKAVDNYSWPFEKRYFEIEKLDYKKALKKYKPDVVICSWMPYESDWTPEFRNTPSVKHYILIGEVEGCTGGSWKERENWKMKFDAMSSAFALCRTDDLWFRENGEPDMFMCHHASVHLFSRK